MIPKIGCRLKGDIFASITERPRPVICTLKYVVIKEGYKHTKNEQKINKQKQKSSSKRGPTTKRRVCTKMYVCASNFLTF